jgi:preprotein translocase subunit SecF
MRRLLEAPLFDIIGKRYWYFLLSALVIVPGLISLILFGLKLGPDFTGGSEITVQIVQANQSTQIGNIMVTSIGVNPEFVQPVIATKCPGSCQYIVRSKAITLSQKRAFNAALHKQYPATPVPVQTFQTVSGTVASSTTQNAIEAVIAAAVAILLYITFAFRKMPHPGRYGTAAIIAMLHDVLVVLGIFSVLGVLLNVEVDATFVTAMLTIIGFSVHDTIVIFDRIRENVNRRTGEPFERVVNHSIMQSFVRSINTSFTVVLTLGAIFLFTGQSIRYFVLAMLIGIISGTYSSIFNASPILVVWENHELSRFFRRNRDQSPTQPPNPVRSRTA